MDRGIFDPIAEQRFQSEQNPGAGGSALTFKEKKRPSNLPRAVQSTTGKRELAICLLG
jgi:hypothetical protein